MAKGKKKGDKKKVEEKEVTEQLSKVSLGESASSSEMPSTSAPAEPAPPAAPEEQEEEGLGLGLGGGKKRPKKKKDPAKSATQGVATAGAGRGAGRGSGQGQPPFGGQQIPGHPGQQAPGYPGQQASGFPGQQVPGFPGQQAPGFPGQQAPGFPGQQAPGFPGQQAPGFPGQQAPGFPGQQALGFPGQQAPGFPGQQAPGFPGQQAPGFPGQQAPAFPGQQAPGFPGQQAPGFPGQQVPGFPGQQAPGFPGQQAPGFPGQQAPGFPGQQAPGFPGQQAPGFPGLQASGFPGQQAPGFPGQQAPGFPGQQAPGFPGQQAPGFLGQQAPGFPGQQTPRPGPAGDPAQARPSGHPQQRAATVGQQPQQPAQQAPAQTPASRPGSQGSQKSLQVVKCKYTIPIRIEGNKVPARNIKLLTNWLAMKIKPMKVYRYDVSIKPDRPKKALPKAFQKFMQKNYPKSIQSTAFDQIKNCYCVRPFDAKKPDRSIEDTVEITDDNGKTMRFEVAVKMTGIVDFTTLLNHMATGGTTLQTPAEAIQCVDVILRQGTLEAYVKAGRAFFKRPNNPLILGDGLEMWTGLFQSAIFTSKPFVNIDVAHKGFPISQPLVTALTSFRLDPSRPLETQRGRSLDSFTSFLKGLLVVAKIAGDQKQKREYIVNEISMPANKQRFLRHDPATNRDYEITVEQYFQENGVRLQYPNLNTVWVGPRTKNIYYPMELLHVAYGQPRNKQLNEIQLAQMVRSAATPPNERKRKIEEVIQAMNYKNNPIFSNFGLEISDKFTEIPGRVMNPPRLQCGGPGSLEPRRGVWNPERVLQGTRLELWGIAAIGLDARACNGEELCRQLKNTGRQMGIEVADPVMRQANVKLPDLHSVMQGALAKKLQLLIVIVPSHVREAYTQVKKVAECSVGMLTQCLKDKTVQNKLNFQTIKNILFKVNSKLMGVNQALDPSTMPACMRAGNVMVVGADVTHPSPDQSNIPSIAAVTASIDKRCFKYNIEFSIQTPKLEMIVQFEDMMVDHLRMYQSQNQNQLPAKIYVFRDGVSEGQFAQVMNSELQAVYDAYKRVSGGRAAPEVMFLLVQKRHHTRFFLGDSANNVEPGTVVDKEIVHPKELDFYLVSHAAIKGTARPTRYHAVCNDGRLPHDEVEQLAYYLCHLYSRCARAVSYPTPTYYAHLACLRARTLTFNDQFDNAQLEKNPKRFRILQSVQRTSPMFFV